MAATTARQQGAGEFRLEPESAVDVAGNQTAATSNEPWLRIEPSALLSRRRWIRLRYSSSYFDDPVRPIIRFETSQSQRFTQFMNGPVLGSGEWVGRVPDHTISVSISPCVRPGPFDFRIDSVIDLSRRDLVRRGLFYDRPSLGKALGAKLINAKEERWEMLKFSASATPFEHYDEWHRRLDRPIDPAGLDRPRSDWSLWPTIRLIMPLASGGIDALHATLSSLQRQVYRRWSLHGLVSSQTPPELLAEFRAQSVKEPRLAEVPGTADVARLTPNLGASDIVSVVAMGDLIPDYALAVIADGFAAQPALQVIYGDEDSVSAKGKLHSPFLKPDWSPIFFGGLGNSGRLACARGDWLIALQLGSVDQFCRDEGVVIDRLAKSSPAAVRHIRRILYRRRREIHGGGRSTLPAVAASAPVVAAVDRMPEVAIVIPTRDRANLLRQCVESLRRQTDYPVYRLIVVDNGSRKSDALALLADLANTPGCHVLRQPGPFNFSALCNAGARAAATSMLVFLNNDIVVIDRDWLKALMAWAVRPDIGVVGAKLLFADGTIEHAGVVLGHGGLAGHIYHQQSPDEPGYLDQLSTPHEVEAVTAACIAIERSKFDAIGGFDENLAVELNDIDLCLRAAQRGWETIWTPHAKLYHLQSASRGYPLKPHTTFRGERDYFLKRWAHAIRDDRYFHPGLSLFSHRPALA